jgi:hypothetical protein
MKIKDVLEKEQPEIEIPYRVWVCFWKEKPNPQFAGDSVSLTNETDYATLEELREAVRWFMDELGIEEAE